MTHFQNHSLSNHTEKMQAKKQNEYSMICAILNELISKKTKKMGPTPAS
jgi:hypothetical protein